MRMLRRTAWPRPRRNWPSTRKSRCSRRPAKRSTPRLAPTARKQLSIPNSSANPFLKGIIDREKKAGAEIGLQVKEWENQGQPSQWVQGMEFAIRDKYDIVDLISGIDPSTIEPQVKAAKEAGVKVMTSHFYDPSDKQNPLVSSSLTIGFGEIGTILANWATVVTDGKANIVLIVSDEVPPTKPLVAGFKSELAAHCPNCKIVQEINVGVTEWATKIQAAVQSAVQAHPEVNVVIPIYDSMSQFVVPALRLTGKTGAVKVGTFNGTPFVLDYIQQGIGRHGHRRKPRLDRLRHDRRPRSRPLRPEIAGGTQRAVLYLRQVQREGRRRAGRLRQGLWRRVCLRLPQAVEASIRRLGCRLLRH